MDLAVMKELMHVSIVCDEDPASRAEIITGKSGQLPHDVSFMSDAQLKTAIARIRRDMRGEM